MRHVEIGALVKDKQLHDGWDAEFECYILDEDRVRLGPATVPLWARVPHDATTLQPVGASHCTKGCL